jgi:hypothetical protein
MKTPEQTAWERAIFDDVMVASPPIAEGDYTVPRDAGSQLLIRVSNETGVTMGIKEKDDA